MTRSQQRLLSQLATSPNELASGLGQCLEALRLISALPRASPIFVHHISGPSPTIKAFGRDHLSRVPLRTVLALIKTSLALQDTIRITTALFYREDGSVDPTPVVVDEDSWKELVPYVHTLHVDDDLERPSTALSAFSTASGTPSAVGVSVEFGGGGVHGGGRGGAHSMAGPAGTPVSRASRLNSNASAFVPSPTLITIKTSDGAKLNLQGLQSLRKHTASPSSPQATSPFAILENTDTCI